MTAGSTSLGSGRSGNDQSVTLDAAIFRLRQDLSEIALIDGCAGCECLLGVAAQALADVRRVPGDEARAAEDDLRRILTDGSDARHACADCDPCLPAEPYETFRQALAKAPALAGPPAHAAAAAPLRGCAGCGCDGCG